MRNLKLSQAWEKWQYEAAEMKRQQDLLRRGLMRMIKRKLAMAMQKWRDEAAEAKRLKYAMGGAIRRMLNRKLSMAWEKWQYEAAEVCNGWCYSPDAESEAVYGMG